MTAVCTGWHGQVDSYFRRLSVTTSKTNVLWLVNEGHCHGESLDCPVVVGVPNPLVVATSLLELRVRRGAVAYVRAGCTPDVDGAIWPGQILVVTTPPSAARRAGSPQFQPHSVVRYQGRAELHHRVTTTCRCFVPYGLAILLPPSTSPCRCGCIVLGQVRGLPAALTASGNQPRPSKYRKRQGSPPTPANDISTDSPRASSN
jgi:hypothetical protein